MKKIYVMLLLAFSPLISAQEEVCKIVGEIALPSVEAGAFLACMRSGNALACKVAFDAHQCSQDPSCSGVVATIVEDGCTFSIKKTEETIEIAGVTAKENVDNLIRTYNALNTVEGMIWLVRYFGQ